MDFNNGNQMNNANGAGQDMYGQNTYTTYAAPGTVGSPIIEQRNTGLAVLGAFLGALLGGILWAAVGMLGFISGWIAVLIYMLSQGGYKKMNRGKLDKLGVVVCIIFSLVMIFPATYFAFAFHWWKALQDAYGNYGFFEVLGDLHLYLTRFEGWGEFYKNLAMGYAFTVIAGLAMGLSALSNKAQARRAEKKAGKQP